MKLHANRCFVTSLALLFAALLALPQSASAWGEKRDKRFQIGIGPGFILSPTGFNMGLEAEYYATKNLSVAPKFSISIPDGAEIYTISAEGRYTLDLAGNDAVVKNLKPWVGVGGGIIIADPDGPRGADAGIQIQMTGGANYYIHANIALSSSMEFTIPFGVRDHFIYRWHVLQVKYLF